MFNYYSKKDFINFLLLNENSKNRLDVIQTSSRSCLIEKNKSFFLSNGYLEPVFDLSIEELSLLQLSDYRISNIQANYSFIKRAVTKIGMILSEPLDVIKQHTSYLAIIESTQGGACDIISSTTFYDYPLCTFFTRYGYFYMPPNIVFHEPNDYVIFDNLYHEALHQKLLIQIILGKIFINHKSLSRDEIIPIPWRDSKWTIEHALQAAYVYIHLYHARVVYRLSLKEGNELSKLNKAIASSKINAIYLFNQLMQLKNIFTEEGRSMIAQLIIEDRLVEDYSSVY